MNSLKPEIIHLYKQREQHQTWLLSHGVLQEDINKILVQSSQVLGAFWSPSLYFLGKNAGGVKRQGSGRKEIKKGQWELADGGGLLSDKLS
jgi:hypothetical protein